MNKKFKLTIFFLSAAITSIAAVCAATIINSRDVVYDNSKSGSTASDVQAAIDDLYSKADNCITGSSSTSTRNYLTNYITNLARTDTTNLAYDDTADKNLRYIGENPNNYVEFNGELWRIIGVMNNVQDANGNTASRVKIIRADSIGNLAWASNNVNNWSTASLQNLLNNGDYYNRTNTYSETGLTSESKGMTSSVVWNLGGGSTHNALTASFYRAERGTLVYGSNPTTWTGYVGLMYPSDYGYAVGGSVRDICLSSSISVYSTNNCHTNDWLYLNNAQWTIYPISSGSIDMMFVSGYGYLDYYYSGNTYNVRPVVYLNTNIKRTSGNGTSDDPYILTDKIENMEDESNAPHPKLDNNDKLIPVILSDDGKVTYVSEDDNDWYNYGEKKWANAIILIDSPSKTYKLGDTIKEEDIESYFVWIPKYKYKLWNTGTASKKAHEIDIIFDTTDTKDIEGKSCKTPMTSGSTGNCDNGEYMTHPAFISLGVDGFWVGKFETGYKDASSTAAAQVNSSDSSKIIIKPNVYSWRNNTVYNFFLSAYEYERELDSHMMKNTEWGAVAYLSHSKYGINNEVNINNNSSFKTGYSALPSTDQHTYPATYGDGASYNQVYNTKVGYLASTTGNITGVYDMSGGAHEYMAAYISGKPGSSGFTTTTLANYDAKYFDVYNANSDTTTYQYRILGDATGEMGPFQQYVDGDKASRMHSIWYGDFSSFVLSTNCWFHRGGYYPNGVLAGLFDSTGYSGVAHDRFSSRIVLVG